MRDEPDSEEASLHAKIRAFSMTKDKEPVVEWAASALSCRLGTLRQSIVKNRIGDSPETEFVNAGSGYLYTVENDCARNEEIKA